VARPLPDEARASVRRIAELDPASVWVGHYGPITERPAEALARAADAD
jgi:hypothetical protein